MKDDRTLKQRFEEADALVRQGREESADDALARKMHEFVEGSDRRVSDQVARLLSPDIEGDLRRKLHLERPVDSVTSSQDSEAELRRIRRRLRGSE